MKTPVRTIRIDPLTWRYAQEQAAAQHKTVSDFIRDRILQTASPEDLGLDADDYSNPLVRKILEAA